MKRTRTEGVQRLTGLLLILGGLLYTTQAFPQEKVAYRVVATHLEGCSCSIACSCAITGLKHNCSFVVATALKEGTYNGVDLKGVKVAAGGLAGSRIYVYVDAPESQREAATGFAKGSYGMLGKIEAVRNVKIDLSGKDGSYTLTIDDGKAAQLTTEPVLGQDKKTPITYVNMDPWPLMQARAVKGTFHEGDLSFKLEGSNSFFNDRFETSGKM
jgi:hypothetical protein